MKNIKMITGNRTLFLGCTAKNGRKCGSEPCDTKERNCLIA